MRRQRRAGIAAIAGDDVEHAFRNPGFQRQLGHADGGQRRVLGRLGDQRVAHRECRADDARQNLQRIVPRHDARHHAMRLAQRQRRVAVEEGDGVAMDLVGGAAVEFEIAHRRRNVGAALAHRLAGIAQFQRRKLGARSSRPAGRAASGSGRARTPACGSMARHRRRRAAACTARSTSALPEAGIDANSQPVGRADDIDALAGQRNRPALPPMICMKARPCATVVDRCAPIAQLSSGFRHTGVYVAVRTGQRRVWHRQTRGRTAMSSSRMRHLGAGKFKSIRI